jgi:hypothetical protein
MEKALRDQEEDCAKFTQQLLTFKVKLGAGFTTLNVFLGSTTFTFYFHLLQSTFASLSLHYLRGFL